MKYLLAIPVLLVLHILSFAQIKIESQSPVFENASLNIQKVLLMKNGNTFYLGLSKKVITTRIYGPDHTLTTTQQLPASIGKQSAFKVIGFYDMNGDAIALVSTIVNHQIVLKRLVFNGENGTLKEEATIGELEKISYFKQFGMAFNVPEPDFFSEAMPDGSGYAVVTMNSFQPDRNKRVIITVYGPDNKQLSCASFKLPDEKYKYTVYLGLAPFEKDKLGVLAYGYNTQASGGKECELLLGTLTIGDTLITITPIDTANKPANRSLARYNPASKKMMLLEVSNKEGHSATIIDPIKKTASRKLLASRKELEAGLPFLSLGGRKQPTIPQNIFANEDGTFTVVYEDITIIQNEKSAGSTNMEDYTVSVLSSDKIDELQHYTIPRYQRRKDLQRPNCFSNAYQYFELAYKQPSSLEAFNFLSANGNNYLFLNEEADNIKRNQEGTKPHVVNTLKKSDAFYYKLNGTNKVPEADYLFNKPAKDENHHLGLFKAFDYSALHKTYVVLKSEGTRKKSSWKIVWMKL